MTYLRASQLPVFLLLSSLSASAATNPVLSDTYLSSTAPTTAFGAQPNILVNSTSTGLLQINPIVPAGTTSAQVAQATLTLYVNGITTAGSIDVRRITKSWGEGAASYSKNITYDSTSYGTITASTTGKFVTVDVTALVQYWIANPGTNLGVALVSTGADASFDSKENTATGHASVLDVTLVNSGPQGPAGPQGAQGIQGVQGPIGATGAIGPQGPTGATGATGAQGPIGPTGVNGATGATGATGTGYYATSTSSVTPGTGTKTFTTQAGLAYVAGSRVRAFFTGAPSTFVEGFVTSYSGTTLSLNADTYNGTTIPTSWTFTIAGVPGVPGVQGAQGATGLSGPQGNAGPQGNVGPQGPSGPIGATGPAGPQGPSGTGLTVKDGNGNVLGTLTSLYPDYSGTLTFKTSTGYVVTAGIDGSIPNTQFYWADSACGGNNANANPVILNAGGPGKGWDHYQFYSAKANQFYVISNANATTHVSQAVNTAYGSLENIDNTVSSGYSCYSGSNTSYGWPVRRATATELGIPSATGTPLAFPAPLSY